MLLIHGPKVVPSFYKSQKGREEGQTLVPLAATASKNIEIWHYRGAPRLNSTVVDQQCFTSSGANGIPTYSILYTVQCTLYTVQGGFLDNKSRIIIPQ
jgi:hypothetical protein